MAVTIQIKRGEKAGLPALSPGEFGLSIDTGEVFIGRGSGNLQLAVLGDNGTVPEEQIPELDYEPLGTASGAVAQHDQDPAAHPDIRAAMLTDTVQVTYNGGGV